MRKTLEAISLAALVLLLWITWRALTGPGHLAGRIPTHFDLAGRPDGSGSPAMLLLLPAVAVLLYLLLGIVVRFPSAFNYPVPVTADNRPRLEALSLSMIAWLKAELICLFVWLQNLAIQAAKHPADGLHAGSFTIPASIILVFATIAWYIKAMRRAA